MANIAIAAGLYRQENHGWPTQLSDLTPKWLAKIPSVPESADSFLVKQINNGLMVYCRYDAEFFAAFDDSEAWWGSAAHGLQTEGPVLYLGEACIQVNLVDD